MQLKTMYDNTQNDLQILDFYNISIELATNWIKLNVIKGRLIKWHTYYMMSSNHSL